jgi:hypothetical protein
MGEEVEVHQAFPQNPQVHFVIPDLKTLRIKDFRVPEENNVRDLRIKQQASGQIELLQVLKRNQRQEIDQNRKQLR